MQFLQNLSATFKRTAHRGRLPFLPGFNEDLPAFIATIDVDYVQRVVVGVEASHREHAMQLLKRAFDAGTLWNDSATLPILMHAFEPVNPDGPMQLASLDEVDELPPPDPSVATMRCIGASHALLRFARTVDASHVILPEETVGLWRPAVRFWWRPFIANLARRQQTVVFGADLPSDEANATAPTPNSYFRYTDSAIVLGATHGRFDSRQPVPGGLWRPGARVSARLGTLEQQYTSVGENLVGFSICYEDYLLWPHWRLYVRRPGVLISIANNWFASDLTLAQIQRQSIESVARLSGVPLLRAVNR